MPKYDDLTVYKNPKKLNNKKVISDLVFIKRMSSEIYTIRNENYNLKNKEAIEKDKDNFKKRKIKRN